MINNKLKVFIITWISYASYYLLRKNLSVAKPLLEQEYGISGIEMGYLDSGFLIAYAIGQFLSGAAADKWGYKYIVFFGMLGSALANFLFSSSNIFYIFLFSIIINGIFQSTGWSGNIKAMTPWFKLEERGKYMGAWCSCYTFGSIISTLLAATLITSGNWSKAFWVPGIIVFFFAILYLILLPDTKENKSSKKDNQDKLFNEFNKSIMNKTILAYGSAFVFIKFIRYSFLFWLPYYLFKTLNIEAHNSAYLSVSLEVGGVLGSVILGIISDKFYPKNRMLVVIFSMLAFVLLIFAKIYLVSNPLQVIIILACIGFTIYGPDSLLSAVGPQIIGGNKSSASAAGIINGMGSIGAIFAGVIPPYFSTKYGWSSLFILFILFAFFSIIILLPISMNSYLKSKEAT